MESHFPDLSVAQNQMVRERVMDDLHLLADDTKMLIRSAVDEVSARAGEARRRAQVAAKRTDELIRAHPYHAVGLGLAAGVLAGWLLSRKN